MQAGNYDYNFAWCEYKQLTHGKIIAVPVKRLLTLSPLKFFLDFKETCSNQTNIFDNCIQVVI